MSDYIGVMILLNSAIAGIILFWLICLISKGKFDKKSELYLAMLLTIVFFTVVNSIIEMRGLSEILFFTDRMKASFLLGAAPSLYFFLLEKNGYELLGTSSLVHYSPLFFFVSLSVIHFLITEETIEVFYYVELIEQSTLFIQIPFYVLLSNRICKSFKRDSIWCLFPMIGFSLTCIGLLTLFIIDAFGITINSQFSGIEYLPFYVSMLLMLYKRFPYAKETLKETSISKNYLSENRMKKYIERINNLMEQEQPYLNPTLKVSDVSNSLQIPSKYISQSINGLLNKNFYEYINYYRVQNVKELLKKEENLRLTLLAVAEKAGFQSGSTFNTSFKKETGMLPSTYRKQLLEVQDKCID